MVVIFELLVESDFGGSSLDGPICMELMRLVTFLLNKKWAEIEVFICRYFSLVPAIRPKVSPYLSPYGGGGGWLFVLIRGS